MYHFRHVNFNVNHAQGWYGRIFFFQNWDELRKVLLVFFEIFGLLVCNITIKDKFHFKMFVVNSTDWFFYSELLEDMSPTTVGVIVFLWGTSPWMQHITPINNKMNCHSLHNHISLIGNYCDPWCMELCKTQHWCPTDHIPVLPVLSSCNNGILSNNQKSQG